MLTQLLHSSMFIPTKNSFLFGVQLANLQTYNFNGSTRKLPETFAILDEIPFVEDFIFGLRTKRTLWVKSFNDIPLFSIMPLMMKRTWLFPLVSIGIGRLWQGGLYQRWTMLQRKNILLPHIKSTMKGDMLRKTMFQLRTGYRRKYFLMKLTR
ncbi:hypothetical protein Fcan01_23092 [Folsomia candida]|uniref:Uncharacterized protein n=1 Tax=Folsomia candida TaxID=158441 RepID=A0A226DBB5_FOLCA|nr:hypothetical protein Fcan01_23092 [Folsomia candida]